MIRRPDGYGNYYQKAKMSISNTFVDATDDSLKWKQAEGTDEEKKIAKKVANRLLGNISFEDIYGNTFLTIKSEMVLSCSD